MRASAISGSTEEIADAFRSFRDAGFTQLEMMCYPGTLATIEALSPVLELVNSD